MQHSYMDYSNPSLSGQKAFLRGINRDNNPCDPRTSANAKTLWDAGWVKQSKIKCRGIELIAGRDWSGCTQSHGDCPTCGK
jgi:hypothetical protein